MMNKKMKQLLGVGLSAVMLLGMTACGNQTPEKTGTSSAVVKTSESTAVEEKTSTESQQEAEAITYPLDAKDVEISIWTNKVKLDSSITKWEDSPFHSGLGDKVGVTIDWQFPADGVNSTTAFNLILAEKTYPDVFFRTPSKGSAELVQLYQDGVIIDLTEYLPVYAPDYWEKINSPEYENVLKSVTDDQGRHFCVASIIEGDYNKTYIGPVIRKDWLDEQKLQIPVTLEDWENVLTVFKEKYGAAYSSEGISDGWFANGSGAYAGASARWYLDLENQEVKLAQSDEEWVEHMKLLNRWFENGLWDNDSVTLDANALRTKAVNGQVGAGMIPMSQFTNWMTDAEVSETGAEWIGISYPRTEAGATVHYSNGAPSNWAGNSAAVVTTSVSEEEIPVILQFLNYGYTEEGMMYWNFGEEGVSYTLDANGEVQWTDVMLNDEGGLNSAVKKYAGAATSPIGVQMSDFVAKKNHEFVAESVNIWIDNNDASSRMVPGLPYTEEESLVYTEKWSAISTYVGEQASYFITGEKDINDDKVLAEFYAELEKMGLSELLKIQNDAYQRYLAK